jgi:NADH-quinone oxidoreductase subunit C
MESLEQIKGRAEAAIPGAKIDIVPNPGPANQPSLLIDNEHVVAVARFLRTDPALFLDFCSNVTGVDWLDRVVKKTIKVKTVVEGVEKEVDQTTEEKIPGYLEAVYHLYSMTHKHGPVIIRMRTANRAECARLPSLTPVWRSAEFQEREIFDLYGIDFTRCAKITCSRTILNGNRRRTMMFWSERSSITLHDRSLMERRKLQPQIHTDETQMKRGSDFRDSEIQICVDLCASVALLNW